MENGEGLPISWLRASVTSLKKKLSPRSLTGRVEVEIKSPAGATI